MVRIDKLLPSVVANLGLHDLMAGEATNDGE